MNYFICAEGGCCGHFLATLIRIMQAPNANLDRFKISSAGSCDHCSSTALLSKYLKENFNTELYSQNDKAFNLIVRTFEKKIPIDKYINPEVRDLDVISVLHYFEKSQIQTLLSLPNTRVIFVDVDPWDYKLAAVNKTVKNFEIEHNSNFDAVKKYRAEMLKVMGRQDYVEELLALKSITDVPDYIVDVIIEYWERRFQRLFNNPNKIKQQDNLLIVNFGDIYRDKNKIITELAKFTQLDVIPFVDTFYNKYLQAQEPYLKRIKGNH